ncbi:sortase domain-containing protein [Corynebacterium kroppenstedtii]
MGKLRIPTFGSDWNYAIIQGMSASDLSRGPRHYTRTQNPGDKGSFALAGHRVGRGAPFNDWGISKPATQSSSKLVNPSTCIASFLSTKKAPIVKLPWHTAHRRR